MVTVTGPIAIADLPPAKPFRPSIRLFAKPEGQSGEAPLEAGELPKNGRGYVAVDIVGILAIRDVEGIHADANFSNLPFRAFLEWNSNWEIPVHFYVE